jgi:hypothetical protein
MGSRRKKIRHAVTARIARNIQQGLRGRLWTPGVLGRSALRTTRLQLRSGYPRRRCGSPQRTTLRTIDCQATREPWARQTRDSLQKNQIKSPASISWLFLRPESYAAAS